MKGDVRDRIRSDAPEALSRLQPMVQASGEGVLRSAGLERRRPAWRQLASWPFALAALVGGSLVFFLDPDQGRRRRALLRDRAYGLSRDAGRAVDRASRFARSQAYGVKRKLTHLRPGAEAGPVDDLVLVDRVMSAAFRGLDPDLKGRLNVDAVGGVIFLRGEIEHPEEIARIERRVRRIRGVKAVENLLHVPGTPAPSAP
jgi:hypothetical protein